MARYRGSPPVHPRHRFRALRLRELERVGGRRGHHHASTRGLYISADRIKTVSNHATGHTVPSDRHGWENRPGVGCRVIAFEGMISGVLKKVLILASRDINSSVVD